MPNPPAVARLSKRLWLLFSLFVLYGTTVPFNFTTDHDVIALHLSQISPNPLVDGETGGRLSIPDTVQNILLFLPFGVLGVLSDRRGRSGWSGLRRILFVTAVGMALSTSVETLQLFTRDRITSTSDVMSNTIGALLGAIAAQSVRGLPDRALRFLASAGLINGRAFYPLMVAVIIICLAQWEPFDVTLDVGSVFSKLKSLRSDLWQYTGLTDEGVALTQFALFGAAVCAWLEQLGSARAVTLAIAAGVALAFGLEGSQILIAARMPGLEKALVRGAGVAVGALLWNVGRRGNARLGWVALVTAATAIGAAIQMLHPFQWAPVPNPIQWLPFMNYYEVTSSNSFSHAIELLLIYFPLGFFFTTVLTLPRRSALATVVVIVLAMAVPLEYFKSFIVGRYPDVTGPCLSAVGGWLGAWFGSRGAELFNDAVAAIES